MASKVIDHVDALFRRQPPPSPELPPSTETDPRYHQLDAFIQREMEARMKKNTSWKHLETCFKWSRVQDYMADCGVTSVDPAYAQVRDMLKANQLTHVQYDTGSRRVIRLNKSANQPFDFEPTSGGVALPPDLSACIDDA
jgi:hypothetical protein